MLSKFLEIKNSFFFFPSDPLGQVQTRMKKKMLGFAIIETLFAGVIFSVCHRIHHVAAWTDCPKTAEGEKDVNFLEQI